MDISGNMLFNLSSEKDRQNFRRYCNSLYLWGCEKGGVVEVKKRHRPRSLQQNAYAHCLFGYFASEFGLTRESVKYDLFKKKVNPDIFERKRINKRGQEITYIRSSSDLDTKEFTLALERFRNWSSMEAGLYLPAPDEHEALVEAEKQITRYAEFI